MAAGDCYRRVLGSVREAAELGHLEGANGDAVQILLGLGQAAVADLQFEVPAGLLLHQLRQLLHVLGKGASLTPQGHVPQGGRMDFGGQKAARQSHNHGEMLKGFHITCLLTIDGKRDISESQSVYSWFAGSGGRRSLQNVRNRRLYLYLNSARIRHHTRYQNRKKNIYTLCHQPHLFIGCFHNELSINKLMKHA
jgi:hypothetical protein